MLLSILDKRSADRYPRFVITRISPDYIMNMKMKTTFLAALLIPCVYGQDPAPAVPWQCNASLETADMEYRLNFQSALSLFPADTEFVMGAFDVSEIAKALFGSKLIRLFNDGESVEVPLQVLGVRNAVVGCGKGTAESMRSMAPLYAALRVGKDSKMLHDFLEDDEALETWVSGLSDQAVVNALNAAKDWMHTGTMPPLLAVVTPERAMMPMVEAQMSAMIAMLKSRAGEWSGVFHEGDYSGIHFSGICIEGSQLADRLQVFTQAMKSNMKKPLTEMLEGLKGRKIYVLGAVRDGKLILSVTEDPATQLKVAANADESILKTDKLAFAYDKIACRPNFLMYADKELMAEMEANERARYAGTRQLLERVVEMADWPDRQTMKDAKAALAGVFEPLSDAKGLPEPCASTCLAWEQDGLRVEITGSKSLWFDDARPLALASLANNPDTILLVEQAVSPIASKRLADIVESAAACVWYGSTIGGGISSRKTLEEEKQYVETVKSLWKSYRFMWEGMGTDSAIVVDGKGSFPKDVSPATQPHLDQMTAPRVALYTSVTDRNRIVSGWNSLLSQVEQLALKEGLSRKDLEKMLPASFRVSSFGNGGMVYSLAEKGDEPNCEPNLILTDESLVLGTSRLWNEEIVRIAQSPSGPARGGLFAFRVGGLKKWMDHNASFVRRIVGKSELVEDVFSGVTALDAALDGIYATASNEEGKCIFRLHVKTK